MDLTYLTRRVKRHALRRAFDLRHNVPEAASAFEGLSPTSLAFTGITVVSGAPHVNVILTDLTPSGIFAGVRTALVVGARLAEVSGRSLRLITFGAMPTPREREQIARLMATDLGFDSSRFTIASGWQCEDVPFTDEDLWVPTFWSTAHAIDVACAVGGIERARVIYLVQDYEPAFYAGSTESEIARSTYHAGFRLLINSTPLARYLTQVENVDITAAQVFRPELDVDGINHARALRESSPHPLCIGFYGRPSKPRNMFRLGVSALKTAATRLESEGIAANFVSFGEAHGPVTVGKTQMKVLGRLPWSTYFHELANVDILLSLQQTPHPSHPPFDQVASGGVAVTNEVRDTRNGFDSKLLAVDTGVRSLADALVAAVDRVSAPSTSLDVLLAGLGTPLGDAIDLLAERDL